MKPFREGAEASTDEASTDEASTKMTGNTTRSCAVAAVKLPGK
jgi:hypothetical protein